MCNTYKVHFGQKLLCRLVGVKNGQEKILFYFPHGMILCVNDSCNQMYWIKQVHGPPGLCQRTICVETCQQKMDLQSANMRSNVRLNGADKLLSPQYASSVAVFDNTFETPDAIAMGAMSTCENASIASVAMTANVAGKLRRWKRSLQDENDELCKRMKRRKQ